MSFRRCPMRVALSMLLGALALLAAADWQSPARAQSLSSFDRQRYTEMLDALKTDIKKNYYDENYHGLNLDEHFKQSQEKIKKATSVSQALGIIAQTLMDFNDSHLYFQPPGKAVKAEYGWRMQMIGDKCFITAVKPGSDAAAKGLKPGDEIYSIDGFEPTRDNIWKMYLYYYQLRPRAGVNLVIQDSNGKLREVAAMSKVEQGKIIQDFEDLLTTGRREEENADYLERNILAAPKNKKDNDLIIWKMHTFVQEPADMDARMSDVRKYKTLVLDLRGNGGGRVDAMERLVSNFFDHEVKIADLKGRKKMDPQMAKGRKDCFKGKVIVLVDSTSGSAAEIFARTMQIEKRGIVLGDRSAGAVMQARGFGHESGVDIVAFYGASITNADVIMTDGKSLEHVGVIPDEVLLPSAADLAAQRDPVLSRAAAVAGYEITPEQAGTFFPIEWKP